MSTKWSRNCAIAIDSEDLTSNLDSYSEVSCDQKNIFVDWYFPTIDSCEDSRWFLFEYGFSFNESCISEVCHAFIKKLLHEFQTEIFLQHPFIIQKLVKWLNENKEPDLILDCLYCLVEKLIKRHYEYTTGLCENFEIINPCNSDSNSQITIMDTYYETTSSNEFSRWGIAKFCVTLMPITLKHISYNTAGAFSLFMSSLNLLQSISNSCNVKFHIESVFSHHKVKNILLNEPLSSLKFLLIAKKLSTLCLLKDQLKEIICNILKQPYWIHLYPELYQQLSVNIFDEEPLELQIIKMIENTYTLLSTCNLGIKQYVELFSTSLPIIWFHQKFNLIDKFFEDTCKCVKLKEDGNNENEYSKIVLSLLSFKSPDVVLHTYSALNKTVKKYLNNFNSESKKIDQLINNLLRTNVLNEIICFGCVNSNEQINQLATEIMEQLLESKNIITNDQWKRFLHNLIPIFPVLCCYANHTSTLGKTICNLFDPDQSEKFKISKLMLLHSIILMLASKDDKCRVEANNRIKWLLLTSCGKSISLPKDIFIIECDDLNVKVEEPIGEYTENDLDDMIDLISNEHSSHQTTKCALYKISVMLEYSHLRQYFLQNGGMNIILNLLKLSKLFLNERGLLIALLKLILCFTKAHKVMNNELNLLANNIEIQLWLISVLSDFYEIPLVKQYVLFILFYCIFNQYLIHFGKIPKVVADKIYTPTKISKYGNNNNNKYDDTVLCSTLVSKIKEDKNCMDVLMLTWHLKQFDCIDLFLKDGPSNGSNNDVFHNFRKASVEWSIKNYLFDLIAAKSNPVALTILNNLKKYLELSAHIEHLEVKYELFENALKKFLILPPICSTDLQTLIVVLKLLNLVLKKKALISKSHWVADVLMKSQSMHHNMIENFTNNENSKQLCHQFFVGLYEVYWLCLKNYSNFSTLSLTKLLFDQLSSTKNEFVLLEVNLKCLTLLTESQKNIDNDLIQIYLSQFISLQSVLLNNSNENSLKRYYLIILNHILHHTVLVPNISKVWCMYNWETWTWSMIHSTDPLVRALVFQFSAGLAVIDIPVSNNLIHLALNYICELDCLENCVVAEQATIFCSNIFCNFKFKTLSLQYIIKLDFNTFVEIINMCSCYENSKLDKKYFSTSPKLVTNICCMLFNMITLAEIDLCALDQNNKFVHALIMCLKTYLTPISIKKPSIMEMCGRICSVLTLFIPITSYNFGSLLTSLNLIYEETNTNIDHCTTMVWRSLFKLTTMVVVQCTNYRKFIITNKLISALLASVTSKNNDLCIDALNFICAICSQLSKKFGHSVCKMLIDTLHLEWHNKQKRKMLLVTLSLIFLEHPFTYETARKENLICVIISKLKTMQLQITKQSAQKSKILQNDYLEIVGFCCNLFNGCNQAREDASTELPDLTHKLWPIVHANPKSDMLISTIKMLVSLTSNCSAACSAMTMTSSTLGVNPKMKSTSYSLFHEVISLTSDFYSSEDILNITLLLILNCCQAQECRVTIAKSKLLSNIISALNLKDKKQFIKCEQQCLNFLLTFTSYIEGQKYLLKVDYALDTLVNLLKSNYKNDSLAILRNLCFNVQNRIILLSSDVFLNSIKTMLENESLTNQQYKDISLAVWSIACNNQKARLQLRHWGIDKYFEKSDVSKCNDETQNIINLTYAVLKS